MNAQKNSPINAILIALVGVLIGFIGGYWIGQGRAPATAGAGQPTTLAQGAANCPHALEAKDLATVAGFRCPGTDESQVLLADCHCPVAHGIQDLVKAEVASGKATDQIRAGIETQYGDRLKFGGQ